MIKKLEHLRYRIFTARGSGFKGKLRDERNFDVHKHLGWSFGYKAKHKIHLIPTLSVKNQEPNNTCTIEAGVVQKEVDEGCVLSSASVITKQKKMGLLSGNGWANLDGIQKVLKSWGIMTEKDCPTSFRIWDVVSNVVIDDVKAAVHKIKSFWEVNSKSAKLQALDEYRVITTAIYWMTSYNGRYLPQNGLLDAQQKKKGYKVGGHSFDNIGYIYGYKDIVNNQLIVGDGIDVYCLQNSYSESWGKSFEYKGHQYRGCFFMPMDFLEKEARWGSYVNLDVDKDTGSFLRDYALKNVRAYTGGAIYYISAGKKRVYPNMLTYLCWNENKDNYVQLSENETDTLTDVVEGDVMNLKKSNFYKKNNGKLKELNDRDLLEEVLKLIYKE